MCLIMVARRYVSFFGEVEIGNKVSLKLVTLLKNSSAVECSSVLRHLVDYIFWCLQIIKYFFQRKFCKKCELIRRKKLPWLVFFKF